MKSKQSAALAGGLAAVVALSGCSGASYDERRAYLDKTAQRGVTSHQRMESQGAKIDKERCKDAYYALSADDVPDGGFSNGGTWLDEVEQTFVEACVSGAAATPAPSGSATPTA